MYGRDVRKNERGKERRDGGHEDVCMVEGMKKGYGEVER